MFAGLPRDEGGMTTVDYALLPALFVIGATAGWLGKRGRAAGSAIETERANLPRATAAASPAPPPVSSR